MSWKLVVGGVVVVEVLVLIVVVVVVLVDVVGMVVVVAVLVDAGGPVVVVLVDVVIVVVRGASVVETEVSMITASGSRVIEPVRISKKGSLVVVAKKLRAWSHVTNASVLSSQSRLSEEWTHISSLFRQKSA